MSNVLKMSLLKTTKGKFILCMVILIIHSAIGFLLWLGLWGSNSKAVISTLTSHSQPSAHNKKTVLFTTHWWGWDPKFPYLKEANEFCPRCHFTENHSLWNVSDAIGFHGRFLDSMVPVRKRQGEIWVFMLWEALSLVDVPSKFENIVLYNGLFNWTMTYRRDSDVYVPYGKFIERNANANANATPMPNFNESWAFIQGAYGKDTYQHLKYVVTPSMENFSDRRMVAWITSHCIAASGREEIVKELSTYLPVDIYGSCESHFNWSKYNKHKHALKTLACRVPKAKAITGVDCRLQISKQYKFYLAFESTSCLDYVTEKFFETLLTEMVPVVYGGADYATMFPPKSFINVRDFKSVEDLAKYLKYLSDHEEKWLEYFEWRKKFWVQNNRFVTGYCKLCDKLWENDNDGVNQNQKRTPTVYNKIWEWWLHEPANIGKNMRPACNHG